MDISTRTVFGELGQSPAEEPPLGGLVLDSDVLSEQPEIDICLPAIKDHAKAAQ